MEPVEKRKVVFFFVLGNTAEEEYYSGLKTRLNGTVENELSDLNKSTAIRCAPGARQSKPRLATELLWASGIWVKEIFAKKPQTF